MAKLLNSGETLDDIFADNRTPTYECNEVNNTIKIVDDPSWGDEIIGGWEGDEVFTELFRHPVFQRLAAVEQLVLPEMYATLPNVTNFTRWEHAWGSVVGTRKLIRKAEAEGVTFTPEEKLEAQVRTFVSDAKQTIFSHWGDWESQGFGGPENMHDITLYGYLERTGVNDILRSFDLDPDRVIFPKKDDFVESPSPNLCIDRVDYGTREIDRLFPAIPGLERNWLEYFTIDDQKRLIMTSQKAAKFFGVAFGCLATEHWGNPLDHLQLQLFSPFVKQALLEDSPVIEWWNVHPSDRFFTVDVDVLAGSQRFNRYNQELRDVMVGISGAQRRNFLRGRQSSIVEYLELLDTGTEDPLPNPLVPFQRSVHQTMIPSNVEIIPLNDIADVAKIPEIDSALTVALPAHKPRGIDPLFRDTDGAVRRLSEVDPGFKAIFDTQRRMQLQAYAARIYLSPSIAAKVKSDIKEIDREYEQLKAEMPPYDSSGFDFVLRSIGGFAIAVSPNNILLKY
jgi:hypothetical protein